MTKTSNKTEADELMMMELDYWNFFLSIYFLFFFFLKIVYLAMFQFV